MFSKNFSSIIGCAAAFCFSQSAIAENGKNVLEVSNFIGTVEVKTAPNAEFKVNIEPGKKFTAKESQFGINHIVRIDEIDTSKLSCNTGIGGKTFKISGKTYKPEDFPKLIVTMPSSDGLRIKNAAIEGVVGDVGGAALELSSCGKVKIGNIAHAIEIEVDGATNVETGNVGEYARISVDGASSLVMGNIGGMADVSFDGVGSLKALSANGLRARVDGAGNVQINGGKGPFDVSLEGTGNVNYDGVAIDPRVRIEGVGNVTVKSFVGNKDVKVDGIGKFKVK